MFKRLLLVTAMLLAGCAGKAPVKDEAPGASAATPVARDSAPRARAAAPAPAVTAISPPSLDDDNNIFFRSAATEFETSERRKLLAHAQRLKADSKQVLLLVGHTDDLGSRSYNLAIAENRVDSVFQAFRSLGVPARQLQRYPVGQEMAGSGCSTADCRKAMRRVELVYRP